MAYRKETEVEKEEGNGTTESEGRKRESWGQIILKCIIYMYEIAK